MFKILKFLKDAHSIHTRMEKFERPKFLKIIVSNSILKSGILHLELKKPFDALVKIGQNERTYPLLDELRTDCFVEIMDLKTKIQKLFPAA